MNHTEWVILSCRQFTLLSHDWINQCWNISNLMRESVKGLELIGDFEPQPKVWAGSQGFSKQQESRQG
jgi:hypothetical protein